MGSLDKEAIRELVSRLREDDYYGSGRKKKKKAAKKKRKTRAKRKSPVRSGKPNLYSEYLKHYKGLPRRKWPTYDEYKSLLARCQYGVLKTKPECKKKRVRRMKPVMATPTRPVVIQSPFEAPVYRAPYRIGQVAIPEELRRVYGAPARYRLVRHPVPPAPAAAAPAIPIPIPEAPPVPPVPTEDEDVVLTKDAIEKVDSSVAMPPINLIIEKIKEIRARHEGKHRGAHSAISALVRKANPAIRDRKLISDATTRFFQEAKKKIDESLAEKVADIVGSTAESQGIDIKDIKEGTKEILEQATAKTEGSGYGYWRGYNGSGYHCPCPCPKYYGGALYDYGYGGDLGGYDYYGYGYSGGDMYDYGGVLDDYGGVLDDYGGVLDDYGGQLEDDYEDDYEYDYDE